MFVPYPKINLIVKRVMKSVSEVASVKLALLFLGAAEQIVLLQTRDSSVHRLLSRLFTLLFLLAWRMNLRVRWTSLLAWRMNLHVRWMSLI